MLTENLKILRKNQKMTQLQIALKLGIKQTTYSGYENGTREPDISTLIKIAELFMVSVDYLIGRYKEQDPPTD